MFTSRITRVWRPCVVALAVIAAFASSYATAQIVTADGNLDAEALLLLDPNGSGLPNIFIQNPQYFHRGWVRFRLDGERILDINQAGTTTGGIDGFRDAGLVFADVPVCDACRDTTLFNGLPSGSLARSGMNTGKLTIIYLANSTSSLATDNSLLYVGMDIFNGNGRYAGTFDGIPADRDKKWHRLDWEPTPFFPLTACANGMLPDPNDPNQPARLGFPFDVDSDGNTARMSRWTTQQPACNNPNLDPNATETDFKKIYELILFTCPPVNFGDGEDGTDWWNQGPPGHALFSEDFGPEDKADRGIVRTLTLTTHTFVEDPNNFNRVHLDAPGFNIPGVTIETFPVDNTLLSAVGVKDVEFVIRKFDTLINATSPISGDPNKDYEINRLRAAQSGVVTISDTDGDSAGEDRISAAWFLPLPSIEVTKEIRCLTAGDGNSPNPWRKSAEALPGSKLQFRITAVNTGNQSLATVLSDFLTGAITPDPNSLQVTLTRPSNPGDNGAVNRGNALSKVPPLSADFFQDPGDPNAPWFLNSLNGTPTCLGVLNGVNVCGTSLVLGDTVVITFTGTVASDPNQFCTTPVAVDIRNSISALGDPDLEGGVGPCPAAPGDPNQIAGNEAVDGKGLIVLDPTNGVDTFREHNQTVVVDGGNGIAQTLATGDDIQVVLPGHLVTPGAILVLAGPNGVIDSPLGGDDKIASGLQFDDNVVDVNVLCRSATFVKDVALCTNCADPNSCVPFLKTVTVHADAIFPQCVRYRYTVTNNGDVDELATFTDDFLCADVAALQGQGVDITLPSCDLCPPQAAVLVPKNGGIAQKFCTVRFGNQAALQAFVNKDDPNNPARTCAALPLPGQNDQGRCYSNCGHVTLNVTNLDSICDGAAAREIRDVATVCMSTCELTVSKKVECIRTCGDPNDPNKYVSVLDATPNSAVRFQTVIQNTSKDPTDCVACKLTITDIMGWGADPNHPTIDPNQIAACDNVRYTLLRFDNPTPITCTDPNNVFNVVGVPFDWFATQCGVSGLRPNPADPNNGDKLVITFDAQIPSVADPNKDALNSVTDVQGFINCPNGNAAFIRHGLPAFAIVNIRRVGLTCNKLWSVQWDKNANCVIDPNDGFINYSNAIDLGTADANQAIIFPARLCMAVDVKNTGEVQMGVKVTDQSFCALAQSTPGVTIDPNCEICDPNNHVKIIDPNATVRWNCCITVDSAAAMRLLAQNDGGVDPNMFENTAIAIGLPTIVCSNLTTQTNCSATIKPPPPCSFTVTKDVECDTDPNSAVHNISALPGAQLTYRIRVQNTSTQVKLPRICVSDLMTAAAPFDPNAWLLPGTCQANLAGTDGTAQICPTFNTVDSRVCYAFAWRPAAPWIAPGETLTITFGVQVPVGGTYDPNHCGDPNADNTNRVTVDGYTEACPTTPLQAKACDTHSDTASINRLVPFITCSKGVCVDRNNDGTCEDPNFQSSVTLPCDANYPFTLIYQFTVRNPGEVDLVNVRVCDDELFTHAQAAGLTIVSNDLTAPDPNHCGGNSAFCKFFLPNVPKCGGSATARCVIRVPDPNAWRLFAGLDSDGSASCYTNTAVTCADASTASVCAFNANRSVSSSCQATVCVTPPCNITVDKESPLHYSVRRRPE